MGKAHKKRYKSRYSHALVFDRASHTESKSSDSRSRLPVVRASGRDRRCSPVDERTFTARRRSPIEHLFCLRTTVSLDEAHGQCPEKQKLFKTLPLSRRSRTGAASGRASRCLGKLSRRVLSWACAGRGFLRHNEPVRHLGYMSVSEVVCTNFQSRLHSPGDYVNLFDPSMTVISGPTEELWLPCSRGYPAVMDPSCTTA